VRRPAVVGQWIAVTERLPAAQERVLFWDFNRGNPALCYGYRDSDDPDSRQWWDVLNTDRDGDATDCYEVTHWHALPGPPPTASGLSATARSDHPKQGGTQGSTERALREALAEAYRRGQALARAQERGMADLASRIDADFPGFVLDKCAALSSLPEEQR
jgi:hypothetical protein